MDLEKSAVKVLSKATGLSSGKIREVLEVPPKPEMGDLSFPCFVLSKDWGKAPGKIAFELRKKLAVPKQFNKIEVAGPYLNFFYNKGKYTKGVVREVVKKKAKYGESDEYKGKQVILDVIGLNPNKSAHVGHVRNGCIGDSVARIMQAVGWRAVKQSFINDMGVPTAMVFWAYKRNKDFLPKRKGWLKKEDHWQGKIYADVNRLMKEERGVKKQVEEMHNLLESAGNKKLLKEQRNFVDKCVNAQAKTWSKFNCQIDLDAHESDILFSGNVDKAVKELEKHGAVYESSDGTLLKLSNYNYFKGLKNPDKILVRPDGRATYTGKDVALQFWRFGLVPDFKYKLANKIGRHKEWSTNNFSGRKNKKLRFNKNDANVMVIASEQEYVIAVDFYSLKAVDKKKYFKNCYHLPTGMVGFGKSAKISSREGTSGLTADEILEQAKAKVLKRMKGISKKKKESIAGSIASGAIRYWLIRTDPIKFVQFDFDNALSLEGNTGPYLQYALVRAKKILKKAGKFRLSSKYVDECTSEQEFELAKKLAHFPNVVSEAAKDYSPHKVANYAFRLCKQFSSFYEACPVLKPESKSLKQARLALVKSFVVVLQKSLNLLGIDEIERM